METLNLDLSPDEVKGVLGFIGYGNTSSAEVWFIGFEEGLAGMTSEDKIKNLKTRGSFDDVMDLYEAHLRLQQGGQPINIELKTPSTPVWQYMAKIMLARSGDETWPSKLSYIPYIRQNLGRRNQKTFLTELSPIPAGGIADTSWRAEFERLETHLTDKIQTRADKLKRILKASNPHPLVICYGLGKREEFAKLLDVDWMPISPGRVFASHDFKYLLLPFFGTGQIGHRDIEMALRHGLLNT
jgi:hypothetical protein